MSRCWLEGEWRAYLDRELPAADMETAGRHLGECRECSALIQELGGRAERVGALMAALEYMPAARPVIVRTPRRKRHWVAAAVGLAAAVAMLMLAWSTRRPAIQRRKPAIVAVVSPDPTAPLRSRLRTKADVKTVPVKANQPEYYLALDDEPIESGVVVQVTLPDSGLLAEVIYDEYGRPRAVRPLN